MNKILELLNGKKTYIVIALAMVTAGLQAYGIVIPEWVYALEAAAGIGTLRVAISKGE